MDLCSVLRKMKDCVQGVNGVLNSGVVSTGDKLRISREMMKDANKMMEEVEELVTKMRKQLAESRTEIYKLQKENSEKSLALNASIAGIFDVINFILIKNCFKQYIL
jgi:uncharacterized membrane protein (DUF106 family)